jgi:hypothetical protein
MKSPCSKLLVVAVLLLVGTALLAAAGVASAFTVTSPGASVILGEPQGAGPPPSGGLLQFNGTNWVAAATPLSVSNGGTGLSSVPAPVVSETVLTASYQLTANTSSTILTVGPLAALPPSPSGKWLIHVAASALFGNSTTSAVEESVMLTTRVGGAGVNRVAEHSMPARSASTQLATSVPISYDAIASAGDTTVEATLAVESTQADVVLASDQVYAAPDVTYVRIVATPY